jgi:putative transposase
LRALDQGTIVDDCIKEAIDLVVNFCISRHYVTRILDQVARCRVHPAAIRTDEEPSSLARRSKNGPIGGVQLEPIRLGKLTQNAYIKSFNGKFKDECLRRVLVAAPSACPCGHQT